MSIVKKNGTVQITGDHLTLEEMHNICRNGFQVELSAEARQNVLESRKVVDRLVEEEKVVYGVTTGFGKFCDTIISKALHEKYREDSMVSVVPAPHSLHAASLEMIRAGHALAKEMHTAFHIHVAEEPFEVEQVKSNTAKAR